MNFTNSSVLNYHECSGHGITISNKCHCDNGWSNVSWFSKETSYACDVNINAVIALSCVVFILSSLTEFLIFYYFWKRLAISKFDLSDLKIRFPFLYLIACCFFSFLSGVYMFRLDNFDQYGAGNSVWYTVVYSIGIMFFYWGVMDSYQNFLLFLKGYFPIMSLTSKEHMISRFNKVNVYKSLYYYSCLFMFLMLSCLVDASHYYIIAIIFNTVYGIWYILSVIFRISPFLKFIVQQLDDSIRDNNMLTYSEKQELIRLRNKIEANRIYDLISGNSFGILLVLMGCWPYFLRKSTYLYLLGLDSMIFVIIASVLHVMPQDKTSTKVSVVPLNVLQSTP